MIKTASAMEVRQNFGELINEVQYKHSSIIIKRGTKEVAAIVSVDLFDRIKLMRKEFDRLTSDLRNSLSVLDSKELEQTLNKAIKSARKLKS
jgi:prevent-host-death family protein